MKPSDTIQRKVIDPKSQTLQEMLMEVPYSLPTLHRMAREKIRLGVWERVWKKVDNRLIQSYRVKK